MIINTLLLIYSVTLTIILILLLPQTYNYRKWYLKILVTPTSNFRVERFFKEMEQVFKKFYPYLNSLNANKGRKATDYCFQFRWLMWWKFFGSNVLQKALREYNESEFLKKVLQGPSTVYTREKFHYFRKKLSSEKIEQWGTELILEMINNKILNIKTIIMDRFPIKSYLNTQKCLKAPKVDYKKLKKFIESLDLDNIVKMINSSQKMYLRIKTKLIVLLVKETWDLNSWNRIWKVLNGEEAKKFNISLPYHYKGVSSIISIVNDLERTVKGKSIELHILEYLTPIIKSIAKRPPNFRLKSFEDLNFTLHKSHRARDPGITLYHCATKDEDKFGRRGIALIVKGLEIPLLLLDTQKYKQGTQSLLIAIKQVKKTFGNLFESCRLLADSEFGITEVLKAIKKNITSHTAIPSYGTSKEKNNLSKEDRDDRKIVERGIGRLESNFQLEKPRHLGRNYVSFHLKVIRLCDIFQVIFNYKIGNSLHPHAVIPIRG